MDTDYTPWKPSLQTIFKDKLLLNALTEYMQSQYNEENILFLKSVKEITDHKYKDNKIDAKIISIYKRYIEQNAEYQINLSYHCYTNILSKGTEFVNFSLNEKYQIFDLCVAEIERLIITSILPTFFAST